MTREIKFRAWSEERKRMFSSEDTEQLPSWLSYGVPVINTAENIHDGEYEEGILMQFTGLHDKNGKEIYEGDILQGGDGFDLIKTDVIFKEGRFCFSNWNLVFSEKNCKLMEVIGNIYDNPELLER